MPVLYSFRPSTLSNDRLRRQTAPARSGAGHGDAIELLLLLPWPEGLQQFPNLTPAHREYTIDRRLELELPALPSLPLPNFLNADQVHRVVAMYPDEPVGRKLFEKRPEAAKVP